MKYFVKIEDGQPVSGVITEQNLLQVFPDMAFNGPPAGFAEVQKADVAPVIPTYYNWAGTEVVMVDGLPVERHVFQPMTQEEREATQLAVKDWHKRTGHKSWVWDEENCCYQPPVPEPQDGKKYDWNEGSLSWVEVEPGEPA